MKKYHSKVNITTKYIEYKHGHIGTSCKSIRRDTFLHSSGSIFCIAKIFCLQICKFSFLSKTFLLQKLISASSTGSFSYFRSKMSLLCCICFILLEMQLFLISKFSDAVNSKTLLLK